MSNINKNIIKQAGAAVANATNMAAGLSASTPEPGSIISVIQLVNGGRTIGPDALAHFTESVRNKLLSLIVNMEPIQSGTGEPSPDNVRPISGRTGLSVYVGPTQYPDDATTYAVDWTSQAGTVYGGTLDVVTGLLTVDRIGVDGGSVDWTKVTGNQYRNFSFTPSPYAKYGTNRRTVISSQYKSEANNTVDASDDNYVWIRGSSTNNTVCVKDTSKESLSARDFKTAMTGVQFVWEISTPQTYQLTPQDIITLVGDNYIWSDSGDVTITE